MRTLVFAGKDLSEFNVVWDGSMVFEKPKKKVDSYAIPFRNGTWFRTQEAFENIKISFPCFIRTNFSKNYSDLVNFLNSFESYKKLETSTEPDIYRMAYFHADVKPKTTSFNNGGKFSIVFDCMPQEFLTSGDTPVNVSNVYKQYTGKTVYIDNPTGQSEVTLFRADFSPKQDFNGYDEPWVGGAGKNKLPSHAVGSTTTNGVTFTANANGTITVNGTATAEAQYAITISNLTGNYYFSGCPSGGSNTTYELYAWDYTASARFKKWNGTTASDSDFGTGNNEINIPSGHNGALSIRIRNGYTANNLVFKPMIRLASETDATYEPYENICPITGWDTIPINTTETSRNLLPSDVLFPETVSGVTFTPNMDYPPTREHGIITADGTAEDDIHLMIYDGLELPEGDYILTGCPAQTFYFLTLYKNGEIVGSQAGEGMRFVVHSGDSIGVGIGIFNRAELLNVEIKPMIRVGTDTDPTYEPYSEEPIPLFTIDLNGTRYGGHVDATTGVLTLTHKFLEFDGVTTGKKVASKGSGNENNYYLGLSDGSAYGMTSAGFVNRETLLSYGYWCSNLRIGGISGSHTFPYTGAYVNSSSVFQPRIFFGTESDVTTVALANAWLADLYNAGKPLQIVYALKEPQTIQLTAQQIELATGMNQYGTDTDGLTVTVKEPFTLVNPTLMESKPLIKIDQAGTYYLNGEQIIQTHGSGAVYPMYIDTETMDAYAFNQYGGKVSMNGYVELTAGFITLWAGENYFYSNARITVTPRWWRL